MTRKKECFEDFVIRWRSEKAQEGKNLLAAIQLNAYIEGVLDLKQIQEDFKRSDLVKYREFDKDGKIGHGAILYCKFMVDNYESDNNQEQELFALISNNLQGLYSNSFVQTQEKVNDLITNCKLWLNAHVTTKKNYDDDVKALCNTLYVFLKILDVGLYNLNGWKKALANRFIDVDNLITEINSLLSLAEEKIAAVQKPAEVNDVERPPQNLAEYFTQYYLQIFKVEPIASLEDKVSTLKVAVKQAKKVSETFKKLIFARSLLSNLLENNERIVGQKYFLDLKRENEFKFRYLMEHIEGEAKELLLENIKCLENPGGYQKISSSIQYTASWITALPTAAMRFTIPQAWQSAIINTTPATIDSECKFLLKILLEQHIAIFDKELISIQTNFMFYDDSIATQKKSYEKFVQNASVNVLDSIISQSSEIIAALNDYDQLLGSTLMMRQHFQDIQDTGEDIRHFLCLYDGFLVKLSNFFAQFCSFFKTETAKLVDKVKSMQEELGTLRKEYQNLHQLSYEAFRNSAKLPQALRTSLIEKSEKIVSQIVETQKANRQAETMKQAWSRIEQRFFKLSSVQKNPSTNEEIHLQCK